MPTLRWRRPAGREVLACDSSLPVMIQPGSAVELSGDDAFDTLAGAASAHAGTEPDAYAVTDATGLCLALHGYESLEAAVPAFPWPDPADMLDTLLEHRVRSGP